MKKYIILFFLLFVATACGPEVTLEIDQDQTRIIHDNEIEMASIYVRIENKGQLPANDLSARFLIVDSNVQAALSGQEEIVFSDSDGNPEQFHLSGGSSFFFAEVFSLETDVTNEDLREGVIVEIYNAQGELLAEHTIERVTQE
ncbi:hypothetical protein [Halalkalibacter alkaliphilus]|uniref:Intracellular proteinase inhibitor BsuPI domain-containing protein n=1 Tax=Halalkalibacter alkaliphilus TaxID=2917993 RepID=A0A9X2I6D6_9BACI|nr:hypothetical protein [Halalkalibacter alkaliphilus]MCL7749136.1 hypothetical protein [Halalkalibacter alkaliphilus]